MDTRSVPETEWKTANGKLSFEELPLANNPECHKEQSARSGAGYRIPALFQHLDRCCFAEYSIRTWVIGSLEHSSDFWRRCSWRVNSARVKNAAGYSHTPRHTNFELCFAAG